MIAEEGIKMKPDDGSLQSLPVCNCGELDHTQCFVDINAPNGVSEGLESLPVCSCVALDDTQSFEDSNGPSDVCEGEELVLEGVMVNDTYISWAELIAILFLQIVSIIAVFSLIETYGTLDMMEHPSWSSQVHDCRAHLHEIIKDAFDPNLLEDPTSTQYICLDEMAHEMQRLGNSSLIDFYDKEKMIERYALIVFLSSLSRLGIRYYQKMKSELGPWNIRPTCTHPHVVCDENEKVVGLVIANKRTTHFCGGSLATEIGALKLLTHVVITRCAINGPIPKELSEMKHLKVLDLQRNSLSGEIPSEIGELQNLQLMFLNDNNFEQKIPSEIGNASSLIQVDFSHNNLNGEIPTQLGSLENLNGIAFEGNKLRGNVEFLCGNDFTKNSSCAMAYANGFEEFLHSIDLGLHIDCYPNIPSIDCDCCNCNL